MRPLDTNLRVLSDQDLPDALHLCRIDPPATVLATTRIESALTDGISHAGGTMMGFPRFGPLQAFAWVGSNIVPVNPFGLADFPGALADGVRRYGRSVSSIVGPRDDVIGLWRALAGHWPNPRAIRDVQYSMVLRQAPLIEPDPSVRLAHAADFDELLPACVAMFTEEVGYSPLQVAPHSYPERVRWLVESNCAWISRGPVGDRFAAIRFKTEVGALTAQVGQLQGVWVHPSQRGRGLSAPAVAAVAGRLREQGRTPALYVNDFNVAAVKTYERVGFERVGTYATVLF